MLWGTAADIVPAAVADPFEVDVYAKANSGGGTIRVYWGGQLASNIVAPWTRPITRVEDVLAGATPGYVLSGITVPATGTHTWTTTTTTTNTVTTTTVNTSTGTGWQAPSAPPPMPGRFLAVTSYSGGTSGATFTRRADTRWVHAYGYGGGGGGGCACGYDEGGLSDAGGGGAQGGMIDAYIDMLTFTTLTGLQVGSGGLGEQTGATYCDANLTGTAGGDTGFTANSTAYLAKGGQGGTAGKSTMYNIALGGSGVSGTNDSAAGAPGGNGILCTRFSTEEWVSGAGGGPGGGRSCTNSSTAGNGGSGHQGAGGAGACTTSGAGDFAGGNGAPGSLRIEEYSAY